MDALTQLIQPNGKHIFTFGYGVRQDHRIFVEYLSRYEIGYVVDVRLKPRARNRYWYADSIKRVCETNGVEYSFKPSLGNTQKKGRWIPVDRLVIDDPLTDLASALNKTSILLLASSAKHLHCHRTEVAEALHKLTKVPILHLD